MDFKELRKIDVSKYTEKKNGLTYLSWAWAVDQLLLADPKAHWYYPEFQRWGNGTVMVFCTVVSNDIARTAQLPVMDYRNKPIAEPDSFSVNTAMQRCLAKAIALHGIGLYIYNGEDVPPDLGEDVTANKETKQAPKVAAKKAPPPAEEFFDDSEPWQMKVDKSGDWVTATSEAVNLLIQLAKKPEDVNNIYKVNKKLFEELKAENEKKYDEIFALFKTTKNDLKGTA
jgi:hypothetical protein